ncbi:hypothetical protein MMC07_006471 [Pseudocyphellaria aurata]|nr:hypothetical protein [Pseudocyphellaria aurata]
MASPTKAASASVVTAVVAASVAVYHGKVPKVDGRRGLYDKFIGQCQKAFDIENNRTNAGQIAFASARLDETPAHDDSLTEHMFHPLTGTTIAIVSTMIFHCLKEYNENATKTTPGHSTMEKDAQENQFESLCDQGG